MTHYIRLLSCMTALGLLAACTETTSTQREYAGARDECREFSELKTRSGFGSNQQGRDQQRGLLMVFKECMEKKGWSVTAPKGDGGGSPTQPPGVAPAPVAVAPLRPPPIENARDRRAAECAYARQARNHSSNARALAKACDIECRNQKRLAPDMPNPASCAE